MLAPSSMQTPSPNQTGGGRPRPTVGELMDQLAFTLYEESPFIGLGSELLDRAAGMFDLHLGMTLSDYQNRWLEVVAVVEEVTAAARTESVRLHKLVQEKGSQSRRWQAEAKKVDDFIAHAFHVAENWFMSATEPLLATYDERFPDDEWFGLVLADYRACEAYGSLTLQQIIDL